MCKAYLERQKWTGLKEFLCCCIQIHTIFIVELTVYFIVEKSWTLLYIVYCKSINQNYYTSNSILILKTESKPTYTSILQEVHNEKHTLGSILKNSTKKYPTTTSILWYYASYQSTYYSKLL